MDIEHNVSLQPFNTFGVDVRAHTFSRIDSGEEAVQVIRSAERKPFVLGGGSNLLFTSDLDRHVLLNNIQGVEVIDQTGSHVIVEVGGGVVWHTLVEWAVQRGYGGIENLALIPGKTGAAPIQNIGAYGVELKESFVSLDAISLASGESRLFESDECDFGYRNSVFKNNYKGAFIITSVRLQLAKAPHHIHDSYGAIKARVKEKELDRPGIADIMDAVIAIRRSKLPDPEDLGNAGSFFKNAIVPASTLAAIQADYPGVIHYKESEDLFKIPSGWLIEQCGWKGKRVGNVGCYKKQALVIVNYGEASGQEILDHAMRVRESVDVKFGISLEPEVNIL